MQLPAPRIRKWAAPRGHRWYLPWAWPAAGGDRWGECGRKGAARPGLAASAQPQGGLSLHPSSALKGDLGPYPYQVEACLGRGPFGLVLLLTLPVIVHYASRVVLIKGLLSFHVKKTHPKPSSTDGCTMF